MKKELKYRLNRLVVNKTNKMKYYIFDREKKKLLDNDGELIYFHSEPELYSYLKNECQFNDDWIGKNFVMMKSCKILRNVEMPEFNETIRNMPQSSKDKVDRQLKIMSLIDTMSQAMRGLYLELPESVAKSVNEIWVGLKNEITKQDGRK